MAVQPTATDAATIALDREYTMPLEALPHQQPRPTRYQGPLVGKCSLPASHQPLATDAANTRTTNAEHDSTMPLLSPSEVELNRALFEVFSVSPAGETALSNATTLALKD